MILRETGGEAMKVIRLVVIGIFLMTGVVLGKVAVDKNTAVVKGKIVTINLDKGVIQIGETTLWVKKNSPILELVKNLRSGDYVEAYYKQEGKFKFVLSIKKIPEKKCGGPK